MDNENLKDSLLAKVEALKGKLDSSQAKRINLGQLERVAKRLAAFSGECSECEEHAGSLLKEVDTMLEANNIMDKPGLSEYDRKVKNIVLHLQGKHKLVTEGSYTGVYMCLGVAIGLVFGTALGNITLGLPIGIGVGLAVGAALDADAKKKGRVI